MPNLVVDLLYWVEGDESAKGNKYHKFILEKGDCDLASFIESINKKEINPTKEEILDLID
jgi:hypothetical protein